MSLPELTIDQAKELAAGGYGKTLLRTAGSYVVPICWPKSSIDQESIHLTNGTAFFVKTPQAIFAVTAGHVVREFLQDKARDPRITCGLVDSETAIDLQRDLIAIGTNVDIATFRVSESVISKLEKQPMTGWPPKTPQIGKGVFYAGFPGQVRQRLAPREFSFGLCSGSGVADHVDLQKVVTSINRDDLVDTLGHGLPPEDFDFGGMSGGPVLALIETGIVSWGLAGVIFEGSRLGGGLLYGARATCLQDDGTISG
jgi:hypothetical protein